MTQQISPTPGHITIRTRDGRRIERPIPRIVRPHGWALAWLGAGTFGWVVAGAVADPVTGLGATLVLIALLHGVAVAALSHGDRRGRIVAAAVSGLGSLSCAVALVAVTLFGGQLPISLGDATPTWLAALALSAAIQSGYALALSELIGTADLVARWLDGRIIDGR
jgi:peptidoglycan/LPS O-acetylase OafA/YrhL